MAQNKYPFSERVLRDMSSAVLVLDSKGKIVYVNHPAARPPPADGRPDD